MKKKAGVSRLSFYRNYNNKEEIIVKYLDDKANLWWEKQIRDRSSDVILGMFNHFYSERDKLKKTKLLILMVLFLVVYSDL